MTEQNSTDQAVLDETVETELTVAEVVQDLAKGLDETVGPYKIWKIVIAALDVFEFDGKRPTSQYMYNYSRNGMIAKREVKPNTDHEYTKDQAVAFITKYVGRKIN